MVYALIKAVIKGNKTPFTWYMEMFLALGDMFVIGAVLFIEPVP